MKFEPVPIPNNQNKKQLGKSAKEAALNNDLQEKQVIARIVERSKQTALEQGYTKFPVHAFPERIQNIINCYYQCYQLPIDYHCVSVLVGVATAIGNAYAVQYKKGVVYPCSLYTALVGPPSIGKSPAIDFGIFPIYNIENTLREQHQEELLEWEEECFRNNLNNNSQNDQPKPVCQEILINDATVEAINGILASNPHGLLLYQDELMAWINSMNTYRKGSDLQYWLSIWSGKRVKSNRKVGGPLFIKNPFISVIGGVQPGILKELATGGKSDNGFLARILFAYPENAKCPHESEVEPDNSVLELYENIIKFIHRLPKDISLPKTPHHMPKVNRIIVPLSTEAKICYRDFLNGYSDQMNATEDEQVISILGKQKQYCLRISLILEMLEYACSAAPDPDSKLGWGTPTLEEMEKMEVSLESMENAILITEYFRRTSLKVIERIESPVKQLPSHIQLFYEGLPDEFHKDQAIKIARTLEKEYGIKIGGDRTIYRYLNNEKGVFFNRLGSGLFAKRYISN